jgi:AraC-like DNA-binding protein
MAVSIFLVRALLDAVDQAGIPRARFFEATGLDPRRVDNVDGRLAREEYESLAQAAMTLTEDEALGLHMGEIASTTTHNIAAQLVAFASTLRQGFDSLNRYHRLLTDSLPWSIVEEERATLTYEPDGEASATFRRFSAEMSLAGFLRMVRFFDREAELFHVDFEHEQPAYAAEYARVFEGKARFGRPATLMVFEKKALDVEQLHRDADFYSALILQAERRLSRLSRNLKYVERVREHLLDASASRRDMVGTARALGLSVRSLRRRLHEEGSSYGEVAEQALATRAKQLLLDEKRSIEETAYTLGFSAPSAFHRAFKRWTGTTPKEYRSTRDSAEIH